MEDVYLDELYILTKKIRNRQSYNYQILLAITQNPYSKKPDELLKQIKAMAEKEPVEEKFDESGFERLKNAIGGIAGSKIIVKE